MLWIDLLATLWADEAHGDSMDQNSSLEMSRSGEVEKVNPACVGRCREVREAPLGDHRSQVLQAAQ